MRWGEEDCEQLHWTVATHNEVLSIYRHKMSRRRIGGGGSERKKKSSVNPRSEFFLYFLNLRTHLINTAWMIKFGRVSYPLIPMYLSFWTWRIYPSYLFSFKVTFCLHFILFGTEFILLIIHETQRTLLGTFLFVVHTFWSFTIVQYFIGWDRGQNN